MISDIILTNVDRFTRIGFVEKAISEDNPKLSEFISCLDEMFYEDGDFGYEFAETFNLQISKRYDESSAKKLIDAVKTSISIPKDSLYIGKLDEVPRGIAGELANEVGGGSYGVIEKARNLDLAYGAFRGNELISFVSASLACSKNWGLSIGGLYTSKEYRHKGVATKLLHCMLNYARRNQLKGLIMTNASWKGQDALFSLKNYVGNRDRSKLEFDTWTEDFRNLASLYFKE